MTNHERANSTGPGRGWIRALLATFLVGWGVLLPAQAQGGGSSNNPSSPGVGRGGDDETIGTLPIVGNHGQIDIVRWMRDVRPSFYLEGQFDEILSVISGCDGFGRVSVEALADGRSRLVFHGRLEVRLDRQLMQAACVDVGAFVPATFRGATAWSGWSGNLTPLGALRTGDLALPVGMLDANGAVFGSPWNLAARSSSYGCYRLQAWADPLQLHLRQSY